MKKRNYWPLFFIGIFSFTFAMIVWTIYSAVKVPVHEDQAFLKSYHDLDKDYNTIVESNKAFNDKYTFELTINEKTFALVNEDMFLSQRVLEEKSQHKNILYVGQNSATLVIRDKHTQAIVPNTKIAFRVSRPTNHHNTMDFDDVQFQADNGIRRMMFNLPLKGNWNITATFTIDKDVGYFYIKSNAK